MEPSVEILDDILAEYGAYCMLAASLAPNLRPMDLQDYSHDRVQQGNDFKLLKPEIDKIQRRFFAERS